jgi:hypothetical protein
LDWKFKVTAPPLDDDADAMLTAYKGAWKVIFNRYENKHVCIRCWFEMQLEDLYCFVAFTLGWQASKSKKARAALKKA